MQSESHEAASYARALLILAEAAGETARFEHDLPAISDLLLGSEEVRRFLADPAVLTAGKTFAVEELLAGAAHPALVHYLQVLQQLGKLHLWRHVAEEFQRAAAEQRQTAAGELRAPAALPAEQVARIEAEVSRILGRTVILRCRVDETLLAGLIVRVGNFVLDGSVDAQLEQVRNGLLKSGDR